MDPAWSSPAGQWIFWIALIVFAAILAFGGGGARADIQSLVFVRSSAVALIGVLFFFYRGWATRGLARPLAFIAACVAVVAIQLVPLPPSIWEALPGRSFFARAADVAGIAQPWRPISLTPDATLNALVATLPPIAAFLAALVMPVRARTKILVAILGVIVLSAVLGAFQMAAGPASPLRLYRVTNESSAVGLFANRNHQAALLAIGIPVACWWFTARDNPIVAPRLGVAGALAAVATLLITLAITGSRAGLALAALALIPAAAFFRWKALFRSRRALIVGAGSLIALAAVLLMNLGRLEAWRRARETNLADELRFQLFGDFLGMASTYFPVGSGFGSFPNLYRHVERIEMLTPAYLNHAHMDLVELAIEGGLAALLLLAVFMVWWVAATIRIWRDRATDTLAGGQRAIGTVITAILLLASLVDYPLRVPMLASLFAFGCALMLLRSERRPNERSDAPPR